MSAVRKGYSIEELKAIVSPVAEKYGVDKVYLFGSRARGDHGEDSDYDFCIERGKIQTLFTLAGFFRELHDAVGCEIDLVTTKSLEPEFLNTVLTEGILVYAH